MNYKQTTQVPNSLFDVHLPQLTESELKLLLVVIRQTTGWIDKKNGGRKLRDRISQWQFRQKTGLSKRVITLAIQSLCTKGLLTVTDFKEVKQRLPQDRKGKKFLYYSANFVPPTSAHFAPKPVQNLYQNKTNSTKINSAKLRTVFSGHIGGLFYKTHTNDTK